jgi:hypothetical protein
VNIFQMSDGSLLVQGVIDSRERKASIEQALRRVGGRLRVQIYTPSELTPGAELYDSPYGALSEPLPPAPPNASAIRVIDFFGVKVPLYDQLYEHFARLRGVTGNTRNEAVRQDLMTFVTGVLAQSDAALFHAWALRRLDVEFPPRRIGHLSPQAVERITAIRDDHRRALTSASREVSRQLAVAIPELSERADRADDATTPADNDGAALVRLTSEQRDIVRGLLTPSMKAPDVEADIARLVVVLRRLG